MGCRWSTPPPPRKDMGLVEVLWEMEYPPPRKDMGPVEVLRDGVPPPPPPGPDTPWTGYAAGGTPLAITQEDFVFGLFPRIVIADIFTVAHRPLVSYPLVY